MSDCLCGHFESCEVCAPNVPHPKPVYVSSSSQCPLRSEYEGDCTHPIGLRPDSYCAFTETDVPNACPLRERPLLIALKPGASMG